MHVPLSGVNVGLLADEVGEAATNTLDGGQGVHHLLATVNVCVEDTQDVSELRLVHEESLNAQR